MLRQLLLGIFCVACLASWANGDTPVLLNYTEFAGAGDVIYIQGTDFGVTPLVQYSYNDANWKSLSVIQSNFNVVTARLPGSETRLPDLLTIRLSNDGVNWCTPIYLNKAIGRFFDTDQIAPNSSFQIFGANLYMGRAPALRFVDIATGVSQFATIASNGNTNYVLKATAPAGIVAGHTYQVYVSNGYSGNSVTPIESLADETLTGRAGGGDPWQLSIPWSADFNFSNNVYNIKSDPRLSNLFAIGNGVADDTWAINHAIDVATAAGGGVIYLPTGTYTIHIPNGCGIQLKPHVVLQGAGAQSVTIQYGYPVGTAGGYGVCFSTQSGLVDLTLNNVDTVQQWQWSGLSIQNSEVFVKRVTWNIGTSQWLVFQNDDHVAIEDSQITQGLDNAFNSLGPLNMSGCSHCQVTGTTINFVTCGIVFDQATDMVFTNNQVFRDISVSPDPNTVTHSIAANFVDNFAAIGNHFESIGKSLPTNNDGEVINTEGGGPTRFDEFRGTISSVTSTTLTDSGQNFFQSANSVPNLRAGIAMVALVSGNALGQVRQVVSVSGDGQTVTIDHPWDVLPVKGSNYATFDWSAKNWIIANNLLINNFKGFELFDASAENILIQSNILMDSDGVMVSPSENPAGSSGALFNVIKNLKIIGNTFDDQAGIHPAYIGLLPREDLQISAFGTHILGAEVKGNNVIAFKSFVNNALPSWDVYKVSTEGYLCSYYWQSSSPYEAAATAPPLLGTIFQSNLAWNSKNTFLLNSGAADTVMSDTYMTGYKLPVLDEVITGAGHASVGSTTQTPLILFPIGTVPANSNDLLGSVASSIGNHLIAMGHQGAAAYSISNGGDNLSILGQEVGVDSDVVTQATLVPGSTSTALLTMRGTLTGSSSFVGIGLTAGSIVVKSRISNATAVHVKTFPINSNSAWLRLVKSGSMIIAMYSLDGVTWDSTQVSVEFSARDYIEGIADLSEGTQTGAEVSFGSLTFTESKALPAATGAERVAFDRLHNALTKIQSWVNVVWKFVKRKFVTRT